MIAIIYIFITLNPTYVGDKWSILEEVEQIHTSTSCVILLISDKAHE